MVLISTVKYGVGVRVLHSTPREPGSHLSLPKLPVALLQGWPIIEAESIGVGSMFLQAQTFVRDDVGGPATHVTGSEQMGSRRDTKVCQFGFQDYELAYLLRSGYPRRYTRTHSTGNYQHTNV